MKTRYCPVIELERSGIPKEQQPSALKMTLIPAIDAVGAKVKPTIIETNIIGISTQDTESVLYDGVKGGLGDLMVTHHDSSENAVSINSKGEFLINLKDDDVKKYSRSREDSLTKHGIYLLYNDHFPKIAYATIIDSNDHTVADVWIQIKQVFNDTYITHTDENGFTLVRGVEGEHYQVILAKSGYEQLIIDDWVFSEDATFTFVYPLVEKVTWDGMYSDTNEAIYVDVHDGGNA